MAETWSKIPGFDAYEVSDLGNVRSWHIRKSVERSQESRLLKTPTAANGYPIVNLWQDNKPTTRYVHHLVAEAFIGPRPHKYDVAHGNGIKTDNRVGNLRYDTRSGNLADRVLHGTDIKGEQVWAAKLTESAVTLLRQLWATGSFKQTELAELFGITQGTVSITVNRKGWQHV